MMLVAFALWFTLSVLAQLPWRWPLWILRLDVCNLLPSYRFFAPRPMTRSPRVWTLDAEAASDFSGQPNWVPVTLMSARSFRTGVWNPRRRGEFALAKLCLAVHDARELGTEPGDIISVPAFRRVLNVVTSQRTQAGRHRDFHLRFAVRDHLAGGAGTEASAYDSGPHPGSV